MRQHFALRVGGASLNCRRGTHITNANSLNSRRLFISRGMEIFDGNLKSLGRNIIARANELAIAERWDVPQVRSPVSLRLSSASDTVEQGSR